jgi:prolyl oligopeptidase
MGLNRVVLRAVPLAALASSALGCAGEAPPREAPIATASASAPAEEPPWPVAEKKPVTTSYHGTTVVDDYQWLEDSKSPAVQAWSDAENAYARSVLDRAPGRTELHAQVEKLLGASSPDWFDLAFEGKRLFAMKSQPPKDQALLVVLSSPDDLASEKVILDPNVLDPSGKTTIDWFVPSRDGKLVAVSLSKGGSERGDVHIYEVDTGKERAGDVLEHVQGGTAGGSVSWNRSNDGLYYTRYPRAGERPKEDEDFYQTVWFHALGTDAKKDAFALGKEFPRIAEVVLSSSDDGAWQLAEVADGDGGDYAYWLLGPGDEAWRRIADFADGVKHAAFGRDGALWLRSTQGAPKGKILRLDPRAGDASKAKEIVPASDVVIQSYEITKSRLYVVDLVGGPSQIRVFDLAGKARGKIDVLPISAVAGITRLDDDDVVFRNQSYIDAPAWYRYGPATKKAASGGAKPAGEHTMKTALATVSPADFTDVEVLRDSCKSKDGTSIPINVVHRKGAALDGSHITLLTGYGGFGIPRVPRFDPTKRIWFDHGGVYAIANIRGGGEFGEDWHFAGNLTKKQNVFDDFIACSRWLIDQKYTSPKKLGILGGSNGGLLMGAVLTQAPELYGAVVSKVGIYDMLRVELTNNGAFNVTEYGSVKDEAQFDALYAYSPYHHVKDGTAYPAVLFMTGANDPRVDPWHSRKMVARLQASGTKRPILLRTSGDTGHGMGTPLSAEIDEETDVEAFLFSELGG